MYPGSQDPEHAIMHGMCPPNMTSEECQQKYQEYIDKYMNSCTREGLARVIHAVQDTFAHGHQTFPTYNGFSHLPPSHLVNDGLPTATDHTSRRFLVISTLQCFADVK